MSEFSLILVLRKENKQNSDITWQRYKLNPRNLLLLEEYFRVMEQFDSAGWDRLPKSFMAENTVFLLLTALIRNSHKAIIQRLDVKRFGLNATSRIKAFVFRFVSVPAKWIRTSRRYVLNIYTCNNAYADIFQTDFG